MIFDDTFRSTLVLSVNLNRYSPNVASHIKLPKLGSPGQGPSTKEGTGEGKREGGECEETESRKW